MNESSFSLLTQKEIDALMNFLSSKDKCITRDVLSQSSIDKLIRLISSNDIHKVELAALDDLDVRPAFDPLKDLQLREDVSEVCELCVALDKDTDFIRLYAKNIETGKEYPITPATLDRTELVSGTTCWGTSIAPVLFDKIARIFQLKYSRQTYNQVYSRYLVKNFDGSTKKIPSLYCPASYQLLDNLL